MGRGLLLALATAFTALGGVLLGGVLDPLIKATGQLFGSTTVTDVGLGLGGLLILAGFAIPLMQSLSESRYHESRGLAIEFEGDKRRWRFLSQSRGESDADPFKAPPITGSSGVLNMSHPDEGDAEYVRLRVRNLRSRPLAEVRVQLKEIRPTSPVHDRQRDLWQQAKRITAKGAGEALSEEERGQRDALLAQLDELDKLINLCGFLAHRGLLLKWTDDDPPSAPSLLGRPLGAKGGPEDEVYLDLARKVDKSPVFCIEFAVDQFRYEPIPAGSYFLHMVGLGTDKESGKAIRPWPVAFELDVAQNGALTVTPKSREECGFQ